MCAGIVSEILSPPRISFVFRCMNTKTFVEIQLLNFRNMSRIVDLVIAVLCPTPDRSHSARGSAISWSFPIIKAHIKGLSELYLLRLSSTHWFSSLLIFIWSARLTLANVMDHLHCNYLVRAPNSLMEMAITCGQYHQTIASLSILHLIHNLPLSPVMAAHIASSHGNNPHPGTRQSDILVTSHLASLQSIHCSTWSLSIPTSSLMYPNIHHHLM